MALAPAKAGEKVKDYQKAKMKYEEQGKDIQKDARAKESETEPAEHRALRYDIGEGMLEIALVLSSLRRAAQRPCFPMRPAVAR